MDQVTWPHLRTHGMTVQAYRAAFPGAPLVSPATSRRRAAATPLAGEHYWTKAEGYSDRQSARLRSVWRRPEHRRKMREASGTSEWLITDHIDRRIKGAYRNMFRCAEEHGTLIHPGYAPYSPTGLLAFYAEIGDIPHGMRQPRRARRDHALGYEPGNMEWQENADNAREGAVRNRERLKATRAAAKARKLAAGLPLRVETTPRRSRREADQRRIAAKSAAAAASQEG